MTYSQIQGSISALGVSPVTCLGTAQGTDFLGDKEWASPVSSDNWLGYFGGGRFFGYVQASTSVTNTLILTLGGVTLFNMGVSCNPGDRIECFWIVTGLSYSGGNVNVQVSGYVRVGNTFNDISSTATLSPTITNGLSSLGLFDLTNQSTGVSDGVVIENCFIN